MEAAAVVGSMAAAVVGLTVGKETAMEQTRKLTGSASSNSKKGDPITVNA